jgi:hypothetical protein
LFNKLIELQETIERKLFLQKKTLKQRLAKDTAPSADSLILTLLQFAVKDSKLV